MAAKSEGKNKLIAVITGDIVNSKTIRDERRILLLESLKDAFGDINRKIIKNKRVSFEIFRGDSFQAIVEDIELALLIGILLRSRLRSIQPKKKSISIKNNIDARISIGIGTADFISRKIPESDGQAFVFSGTNLDSMKETEKRLKIKTPWEDANAELEVECSFADAVISSWSVHQAEAIYKYLLENPTQHEIAEMLNISQPALRKRLKTGQAESIDLLKKRFESLITSRI